MDTSSPQNLYNTARSLERCGKQEEACRLYLQAMQLAPSHALSQYRAFKLLAEQATRAASQPTCPSHAAREPLPSTPTLSVVICSVDSRKFASVCSNYRRLLDGSSYEIVRIHDARSLCEGYNRGFARSRGDIVVFSHDDIEILAPDMAAKLLDALRDRDIVGVAGSTLFPASGRWWGFQTGSPHTRGVVAHRAPGEDTYALYVFGVGAAVDDGIQVLDGLFFAARREVLETVEFDARTFDGFHCYDIDFTYRAFLAGFRIGVSNELAIVHQSRGKFGSEWRSYADRFLAKHRPVRRPTVAAPCFWDMNIARLRTAAEIVELSKSLVATAEAARAAHAHSADRAL